MFERITPDDDRRIYWRNDSQAQPPVEVSVPHGLDLAVSTSGSCIRSYRLVDYIHLWHWGSLSTKAATRYRLRMSACSTRVDHHSARQKLFSAKRSTFDGVCQLRCPALKDATRPTCALQGLRARPIDGRHGSIVLDSICECPVRHKGLAGRRRRSTVIAAVMSAIGAASLRFPMSAASHPVRCRRDHSLWNHLPPVYCHRSSGYRPRPFDAPMSGF